jgi:maltose/moltooligosaccharide transporter
MCFGFLGIQFAFALQNGNVSYIFQTLGAKIETWRSCGSPRR